MSERSAWNSWQIEEPLGEGGSGIVYRATHRENPDLESAIKMIDIPAEEELAEMRREGCTEEKIRAEAKLRTANIEIKTDTEGDGIFYRDQPAGQPGMVVWYSAEGEMLRAEKGLESREWLEAVKTMEGVRLIP